jgi:multiple sugar transport system permease protein
MADRDGDQLQQVDPGLNLDQADRAGGAAPSGPVQRGATMRQREQRLAYALIGPGVIIVLALVLLPVLWNFALSFRELRLIELRDFNPFAFDFSLENYSEVTGDSDFFTLLRTTLLYALLGTSLAIIMGLWAAMVLQKSFRGRSLVRGLVLFPYVVPVVAAALLWRTMLNPQLGIMNAWLQALFNTGNVNFLTQQSFELNIFGAQFSFPAAFTMVVLFEGWRSFPFAFLFILARLQSLPSDMYEAAQVDGATATQAFFRITLPQLKTVFAVLFLLRFIWTFNTFDEIYLLTGGAAGTQVVSVQIFEYLFGRSDVGAAAALSMVLAVVLAALLLVYFRFAPSEEAV